MNHFTQTAVVVHILVATAMIPAAHADFTGSVTIDPFTAPVSIVRGEGNTTFLEFGISGGIFDTARYALQHDDLGSNQPGYSSLSLFTDPIHGRLTTNS